MKIKIKITIKIKLKIKMKIQDVFSPTISNPNSVNFGTNLDWIKVKKNSEGKQYHKLD